VDSARDANRVKRPRRRRRAWWIVGSGVLLIAVALVGARLALPSYLEDYVERVLDQSPGYDGRIGRIEVHLWRGAYSIHDVTIVKTTHTVPVPFFESPRVDLALDWSALLRGGARGRILMEKPRLNFVHGPSAEDTQTGVDQPWLSMIHDLFPFRIDKAEVTGGEIHFQAFHTRPAVDVYLSEVQGEVRNLTNVEDKLDPLIATVHATGVAMGSGDLELDMSLDPQSHRPRFDLAVRLLHLDVTRLEPLTQAFGDFDFASGRFDLVVEVMAEEGAIRGYAKPLFRNLKVVSVRDFETDDPLQVLWEALVGAVGTVFKNQARDQFGTSITLEGDLNDPRTDILEIVGNVLRNAFVRAYLPRLEYRVSPYGDTAEAPASGQGVSNERP